jgi:hypothetical protein
MILGMTAQHDASVKSEHSYIDGDLDHRSERW